MSDNPEDYKLLHYGVKGMKWGVRKEATKNVNKYFDGIRANQHTKTLPISKADYDSMSTKPVQLGSNFSRLAAKDRTGLSPVAYVTNNADDHNRYVAFFPPEGNAKNLKGRVSLKIDTPKAVVSPSEKERIDIFIDLIGKRKIDTGDGHVRSGRELLGISSTTDPLNALNDRELGLKFYNAFAQNQHYRQPITTEYFKEVQKRGYSALVDDADRGLISDLPIILFPEKSGARVSEVKKLTKEDIWNAKLNTKVVT